MHCYYKAAKRFPNNCRATIQRKTFSTLQNFPISNEDALKCVKCVVTKGQLISKGLLMSSFGPK